MCVCGGVSFLTAWWIKLLVSLVVRERRLLYLLPEGRRLNRLCAGWLASLTIVFALPVRRVVYMSCREESGAPMILPAVFTMSCRAFFVVVSAAPAPHRDATGKDALNSAPVECAHDGLWCTCSLQFAQEVEAPLGFLRQ